MRMTEAVLPLLLLISGCAGDPGGPSQERCDRPSGGQRCSSNGATAIRDGTNWKVTFYTTTSTREEYEDHGYLCTRTVFTCTERHCTLVNAAGTMTAAQAIAHCQN
jgi:hypothetical protein